MPSISRRSILAGAAGVGASVTAGRLATPAIAQDTPLKIGVMLPFSVLSLYWAR